MKKANIWLSCALLAAALPAFAQHEEHGGGGAPDGGGEMHGAPAQRGGGERGGNFGGGYIPQRGPERGNGGNAGHQESRGNAGHTDFRDAQGHPNAPHVDPGGRWVGHDVNHESYHLDHPWAHGHFPGHIGPSYVYRLGGGGPDRFFFDGGYFAVAPADLPYVGNWLWNSDDVILYDDPDDPGYYLAYNPRLGVYVHVMYLG